MPKVARNKSNNFISKNWYIQKNKCKKGLGAENFALTDLLFYTLGIKPIIWQYE